MPVQNSIEDTRTAMAIFRTYVKLVTGLGTKTQRANFEDIYFLMHLLSAYTVLNILPRNKKKLTIYLISSGIKFNYIGINVQSVTT